MVNPKKILSYEPDWPDDVLKRSESAKFLTKYLNSLYGDSEADAIYSDSFVLCLNADWGYGKTFLIHNWANDLRTKLNHPAIYFDAWKNDYSDDPLLAFIGELEGSLKAYQDKIPQGSALISNVIETGKGAIAPALKTLTNILVKKAIGTDIDGVAEVFSAASEGAIETYMNSALESHKNRKEKIKVFSGKLENLLVELNRGGFQLPMYIFIDELDRCKPSYAIQLLEGIKHIFGTKGIFFVVATNKHQLSKSIKAVYGSEFDSISYLQRFFDQEYQIPAPDFEGFAKLLIEKYYRLNQLQIEDLGLKGSITKTFAILAEGFQLSLRAQTQAVKQLKAIALSESIPGKIHHWFLIFLIMFRIKNEAAYDEYLLQVNTSQSYEFLKDFFDVRLSIPGTVGQGDFQTRNEYILVINIIKEYFRLEALSAIKLLDGHSKVGTIGAISGALRNEVPQVHTPGNQYPLSISKYRKIILQAGHLS